MPLWLQARSSANEREDFVRVVDPVLQIMRQLHELCEEHAFPMWMVHPMSDSLDSTVPLSPAPPLQLYKSLAKRSLMLGMKVWTMLSFSRLSPSGRGFPWVTRLLRRVLCHLFLELSSPKNFVTFSSAWRWIALDLEGDCLPPNGEGNGDKIKKVYEYLMSKGKKTNTTRNASVAA
jgi:hypothetical protein